jgi:hypothetical protein
MDGIKKNVEEIAVVVIAGTRRIFTPFFDKYSGFYEYINYIFYFTYAIILFGVYHTTPETIPALRNAILYIAVFILLIRFNSISWNNPKFALLGGNRFSEFDRKLIFSLCTFILFTHIVSDAVASYAKDKINQAVTQPVSKTVIQPVYQYIDTSGAVDNIPALKKFFQDASAKSGSVSTPTSQAQAQAPAQAQAQAQAQAPAQPVQISTGYMNSPVPVAGFAPEPALQQETFSSVYTDIGAGVGVGAGA